MDKCFDELKKHLNKNLEIKKDSKFVFIYSTNKKSTIDKNRIEQIAKSIFRGAEDPFEISNHQWVITVSDLKPVIGKTVLKNIGKETLKFNPFKTLKDLYQEIRNTQMDLCCERAMKYVESYHKDCSIEQTFHAQINLLVEEKKYFLHFLEF